MTQLETKQAGTIGERIALIRGRKSRPVFAQELGINKNTLERYEKGVTSPNLELAAQICGRYGVSIRWLVYGEGEWLEEKGQQESVKLPAQAKLKETSIPIAPARQSPDPEMFAYVPLVSTHLSAGGGAFVYSEDVIGFYAFRKSWLKRTTSGVNNLVLSIVTGNSMMPTLKEKDFVMVDSGQTKIADDLIYAIRVDDTVMVKRLRLRPGGKIKIISDNQEYESYDTTHQDLHVIGQVVWSCRSYLTGL